MFVIRFLVAEVTVFAGSVITGIAAGMSAGAIALLCFGSLVAMQVILLVWVAVATYRRVRPKAPKAAKRARSADRLMVTRHESLLP